MIPAPVVLAASLGYLALLFAIAAFIEGLTWAGLLIALVGTGWVFVIDAVSVAAIIVCLWLMDPRALQPAPRAASKGGIASRGIIAPRYWITVLAVRCPRFAADSASPPVSRWPKRLRAWSTASAPSAARRQAPPSVRRPVRSAPWPAQRSAPSPR